MSYLCKHNSIFIGTLYFSKRMHASSQFNQPCMLTHVKRLDHVQCDSDAVQELPFKFVLQEMNFPFFFLIRSRLDFISTCQDMDDELRQLRESAHAIAVVEPNDVQAKTSVLID